MQLKIITRDGQCRGRPPTCRTSRDGPKTAGSSIPATGRQQSAISWWWPAVYSRSPARLELGLIVLRQTKRANDGRRKLLLTLGHGKIKIPSARDWITHTCSVNPNHFHWPGTNTRWNKKALANMLQDRWSMPGRER